MIPSDRRSLRPAAIKALLGMLVVMTCSTGNAEEEFPPLATPDPATIPYPGGRIPTAAEVELGRLLFFDTRLSHNQRISCATCHNPDFGFSDGHTTGFGHRDNRLRRNSPSLFNLAWSTSFFWDGRASTLEEQALMPIKDPEEMGLPIPELVKRLEAVPAYQDRFAAVYPKERINPATIAKAIASFERTLVSRRSPFDRYLAGDKNAMSEEQIRGMRLFQDKHRTNCMACHSGPNFTDNKFHNLGLPGNDLGRWEVSEEEPAHRGAFKTPSLRNVALTAPYMHDGSQATLEQVIIFYNGTEGTPRPAGTDPLMRSTMDMGQGEMRDLVTFLSALTDPVPVERPTPP